MCSNFKVWFNILDKLVEQKKISIAVFKANVHHLDHAIFVIKQNSTLRGTSVRVMERNIGEIKKTLKARVNVGENVNNIIRRKGLLTFIKNTGMMSFQSLKEQEEERCSHKASTFMYHPSMKEHDRSIRSQLWVPFLDEFTFSSNEDDFDELLVQGLVTKGNFIKALKGCQKRLFFSTSIRDPRPDFNFDEPVRVAGRAWQSDVVYTSSFGKHRISKKVNKRGGEYVMFDSYHIKRT